VIEVVMLGIIRHLAGATWHDDGTICNTHDLVPVVLSKTPAVNL
jgi:hypothetical protein